MKIALIALAAFLFLPACTVEEKLVDLGYRFAGKYCLAGEMERQALRNKFTTPKGPVFTVNCENLE